MPTVLARRSRWVVSRRLIILGSVLLPVPDLLAQPYRARVRLPGYAHIIAMDTIAVRTDVPASRLEVFQVAAAALETEFKFELKIRDSTAGLVGNMELVKLRSLGRWPTACLATSPGSTRALEDQRCVGTTESEGVVHDRTYGYLARCAPHDVDALSVGV